MTETLEMLRDRRHFSECRDPRDMLDVSDGQRLVIGIADARRLAWPAALNLRQAGANLAITRLGDRASPRVAPQGRCGRPPAGH